jgi:hypothetical protein
VSKSIYLVLHKALLIFPLLPAIGYCGRLFNISASYSVISGSNLVPLTGYACWGHFVFLLSPLHKYWDRSLPLVSTNFQFASTLLFDIVQGESSVLSSGLIYAVSHSKCYTLLLKNTSRYSVPQQALLLLPSSFLFFWLCFFSPCSCALLCTFISKRDCTQLQCFYKGCTQSNQQLALSRLMHCIRCDRAVFLYQELERRPVQEIVGLIGRAGQRNRKFDVTEHSLCVTYAVQIATVMRCSVS